MSSVEITNPTRILNTTYTPGGASYVAATRYISQTQQENRRRREEGEEGARWWGGGYPGRGDDVIQREVGRRASYSPWGIVFGPGLRVLCGE